MIFTFSAITLAEIICVIKSTSLIALLMSLLVSYCYLPDLKTNISKIPNS